MDPITLQQLKDPVLLEKARAQLRQPSDVYAITWLNLQFIKPEWLSDDGILYNFKLFVQGVAQGGIPAEAAYCFNQLYNLLKQVPNLPQKRPDMFVEYLRLLAVLKACFLTTLDETDVEAFLREVLLYTLEVQDFDVSEKLNQVLIFFRKDPEIFDIIRKKELEAMEQNKQFLGTEGLTIENHAGVQAPTAANWLSDYNQFAVGYAPKTRTGLVQRSADPLGGSLERIAYMQKSVNVRKLSQDEKVVIFRLLELYDWLKSVKPTSEFLAVFSDYTQIPELAGKQAEPTPQIPTAPAPQAGPQKVTAPKPVQPQAPIPKPAVAEKRAEAPPGLGPQFADLSELEKRMTMPQSLRPVNVQDILNRRLQQGEEGRGLQFSQIELRKGLNKADKTISDQPGPASAQSTGKISEDPAAKIEQKLAELKKRTNSGQKPNP